MRYIEVVVERSTVVHVLPRLSPSSFAVQFSSGSPPTKGTNAVSHRAGQRDRFLHLHLCLALNLPRPIYLPFAFTLSQPHAIHTTRNRNQSGVSRWPLHEDCRILFWLLARSCPSSAQAMLAECSCPPWPELEADYMSQPWNTHGTVPSTTRMGNATYMEGLCSSLRP